MPQFYQETTDDEGNKTYELVEADTLPDLLDDDVIRSTSVYKGVLDESVKRRKTIRSLKEEGKGLREALDTAQGEDDTDEDDADEDDTDTSTQDNEGLSFSSREELAEYVIGHIDSREAARLVAVTAQKETIDELLKQHKLTEAARPVIEGAQNLEETASYLGRLEARFDDAEGGEMATTSDGVELLMEGVMRKLELNNE